jgi:hypothetical protein
MTTRAELVCMFNNTHSDKEEVRYPTFISLLVCASYVDMFISRNHDGAAIAGKEDLTTRVSFSISKLTRVENISGVIRLKPFVHFPSCNIGWLTTVTSAREVHALDLEGCLDTSALVVSEYWVGDRTLAT